MSIKMEFRRDEFEYIRYALIMARADEADALKNGYSESAKWLAMANNLLERLDAAVYAVNDRSMEEPVEYVSMEVK